MMLPRAALLSAAFVASFVAATPARAAGAADQAAAEVLFNEAKTLMNAGDHARACPKFVESQRLDPTVGTLLNIGNCYEKAGKLASAWGAFKAAEMTARNAGDTGRQGEAARRAEALAPRLAKLTIAVAAAPIAGLQVRRDGELVGEGQWGSALPVDVGEHEIEVTAPGRQKWTTKVQVAAQGASVTVSVPELAPEVGGGATAEGSAWGAQRIAGVAVGGAGVISLVVGAVFGARAISKNNESKAQCSPTDPTFCNSTGAALRGEVKTAGTISTAAVVVGGVLVAGGVVLAVTAPSAKAADGLRLTAGAGVGSADFGLAIGRRW